MKTAKKDSKCDVMDDMINLSHGAFMTLIGDDFYLMNYPFCELSIVLPIDEFMDLVAGVNCISGHLEEFEESVIVEGTLTTDVCHGGWICEFATEKSQPVVFYPTKHFVVHLDLDDFREFASDLAEVGSEVLSHFKKNKDKVVNFNDEMIEFCKKSGIDIIEIESQMTNSKVRSSLN